MKKSWISPKLSNYGSVEELTQVVKYIGAQDGVFFDIDGPNANNIAPIAIGVFS